MSRRKEETSEKTCQQCGYRVNSGHCDEKNKFVKRKRKVCDSFFEEAALVAKK